jgi:hypothetical protein
MTKIVPRVVLLFMLIWGSVGCAAATASPREVPTALPEIRHRDALPLMLQVQDLGSGYEIAETHRLAQGKGWGDDTTRLSGYQTIFRGEGDVFSEVTCQVECYLTVKDAQDAYRVYRQEIAAELRDEASFDSVTDAEERALGEWNHVYVAQSREAILIEYVFLRNNAFVFLSFAGPQAPGFTDKAAEQARLLDSRIFRR